MRLLYIYIYSKDKCLYQKNNIYTHTRWRALSTGILARLGGLQDVDPHFCRSNPDVCELNTHTHTHTHTMKGPFCGHTGPSWWSAGCRSPFLQVKSGCLRTQFILVQVKASLLHLISACSLMFFFGGTFVFSCFNPWTSSNLGGYIHKLPSIHVLYHLHKTMFLLTVARATVV